MIKKDEVFPVGQLNKPHGINGEMSFTFTTDIFDTAQSPYFIIETEGIFVPFFIEEYRFKTDETGLLKLEGIDSEEKARHLSGLALYLPKSYLDEVEDDEIELNYFVGFHLIDNTYGEVGIITEIDQTTENALFVIDKEDDELLIPVGDDYVTEIDHDAKNLYVDLPEGLLTL